MASARLDILKSMVARNPGDSFSRYGLAMEYRNAGDAAAALAEFETLLAADPEYAAAYYQCGQTLEALGRADDAGEMYRRGIEVTGRQGKQHALNELRAALDALA